MKRRIQDMDVKNKRVLLRCDFNVPVKDGVILDDSKIVAALFTIDYLVKQGAKVIFSKQPRSLYLEGKIEEMNPGEILVLENTRFEDVPNKLESGNDSQLAMYWAELADIYCLDAFGSAHRKHASTHAIANYLPSCIGFLVQKEVEMLDGYILNAKKPFTIVMGGAKVEDKVELIESLLPRCDHLILVGGIANSCLATLGFNVGSSLRTKDPEVLSKIKEILIQYKDKIVLPVDAIIGREYSEEIEHVNIDKVFDDDIIYDIGMKSVNKFKEIIDESETIFVNGTAGKYEDNRFANGTRALLETIVNSKAVKIVGGGDGVSAAKHFNLGDRFTFLSTGGGATLEYIINEGLPAIDNILDKE